MEEDVELMTGEGQGELASGVTFDELGQIHGMLRRGHLSKKENSIVRDMVRKVLPTDLFEMMVWQSPGGCEQVNQVLKELFDEEPDMENEIGEVSVDQQKLENFQLADFV